MKLKFLFIFAITLLIFSSCRKYDEPSVDISFLCQTQTTYSHGTPGVITIDYIIYNNTYYELNYCAVCFIVYYKDNSFEITKPDVTVGIRNDQRNDLRIFTDKEMLYVDVHSVLIDGGGCKYNIISR